MKQYGCYGVMELSNPEASAEGRMKMIEKLSRFGSDPTVIDPQGCSCLHHAAFRGSVEGWEILVEDCLGEHVGD